MSGSGGGGLRGPSALACPPLPQFRVGGHEELLVLVAAVLADGAAHVSDQVGGRGSPPTGAYVAERLPHRVGRAEVLERSGASGVLLCGHKVIVSNLLRAVK